MDNRMNLLLNVLTLAAIFGSTISAKYEDGTSSSRYSRSPAVEVLMHLPPSFADVDAFRSFLGVRPERRRRDVNALWRRKREAAPSEALLTEGQGTDDVPQQYETIPEEPNKRIQREAMPGSTVVDSAPLMVEPSGYPTNLKLTRYPDAVLEMMGQDPSMYAPDTDPEDPRKRRNTSANDHEDKRAYPEPGMNQDGTTAPPFWKHKKASPPFVTAREGRQNYDQPQHRSNDNSRESHSMKDGSSKPVSSNEITRMGDSYYSASNANNANSRAYNARQTDNPPPKSVYDTIDYTARRGQGRNADARGRLTTDAYGARPYDRYYYPFGGEVAGRGVEYYHRSIDPGTGRIVYYASLPEPDAYRASRTYSYDAYGRSLPAYPTYPVPPINPYQPYNPYNPYPYQPAYSAPVQDYSRSARYQQPYRYDKYEDPRNKTYVIFDAEEKRNVGSYAGKPFDDRSRYTPPLPYPSFPSPTTYPGYQPIPMYTPYNSYNAYSRGGYSDPRGLVRQVELPLSSRSALKPVNT